VLPVVAVLSYPGFTLWMFEHKFEPSDSIDPEGTPRGVPSAQDDSLARLWPRGRTFAGPVPAGTNLRRLPNPQAAGGRSRVGEG